MGSYIKEASIRNFKPGENGVIYSKYKKKKVSIKTYMPGNFPCGPVARTSHSQNREPDLIPGHRTRSHMPQ